jgi:hypothetical protein
MTVIRLLPQKNFVKKRDEEEEKTLPLLPAPLPSSALYIPPKAPLRLSPNTYPYSCMHTHMSLVIIYL